MANETGSHRNIIYFATGYDVVFEKQWLIIFKESFILKADLMNNCKLSAML
jgi:hypothetical protein